MKLDELEIAYTIDVLERLVQSADGYIDDSNWLEPLTDDIKNAKQLIKGYKTRLKQEECGK
jgi:hypothetical protein